MLYSLQRLPGVVAARAIGGSIKRPADPVSFVVEFDPAQLTIEAIVTATVKALEENPDPRYRAVPLEVIWMPVLGEP